ncbi:MAG: glycosyltransferase family A protein [Ruthenibacterium sp.]
MKATHSLQHEPFITVGIASYNYARFLPRAFAAMKRQSFRDFEILYCDDGSTDDSIAVIRGFIKENPELQIRLICGENLGVMGNKKRILDNARGTYMMLCDADDWMGDDCLEKLSAAARETHADRVISQACEIDERNNIISIFSFTDPPCKWACIFHHGCLYRRAFLAEHGITFQEDVYPDDFYLTLWCNAYAKKIAFIKDYVYFRYAHAQSTYTGGQMNTDSPWFCINALRQMLSYALPVRDLVSDQDKNELEFELIKRYYSCLSDVRGAPLRQIFTVYKQARDMMRDAMPEYKNSYYMRHSAGRPVAAKRRSMMQICITAEKLHIMWLAIIGLKAVSIISKRRRK